MYVWVSSIILQSGLEFLHCSLKTIIIYAFMQNVFIFWNKPPWRVLVHISTLLQYLPLSALYKFHIFMCILQLLKILCSKMDPAEIRLKLKVLIKGRGAEIFSEFHLAFGLWEPFQIIAPPCTQLAIRNLISNDARSSACAFGIHRKDDYKEIYVPHL